MKRISALTLSILLSTQTCLAWGEDLMQLYQQAQQGDPILQAAAAERRARLEVAPQARSALLPSIALSGSVSRERFDPRTSGDTTYSTNKVYGLQLRQTLYRHDQWLQLKQSEYGIAQAEADYAAAESDLLLRVAQAYFTALGAHDNLQFAIAEKSAISRQLDQAQQRFEVGLTAITDVHEAQAAYDLAISREISAQGELDNAYEALRELTGVKAERLAALDQLPLLQPVPLSPDRWVETALQQNLELVSAQAELAIRKEDIGIQRAGHLPTLDLTASSQYQDQNFGGIAPIERNDTAVGIELNLPLYQGGLVNSRTREARERFQQAQARVEQAQRSAERATRDAYRGVLTDISQVKALEQALVSTRTALRAQEAGMEVGTRTIVDVLNAQRELYGAERNRAQARYTYLLNGLSLKQAAGILAVEDLALINQQLQLP